MRKRTIAPHSPASPSPEGAWLDLEQIAEVEVTSEADAFPIEAALLPHHTGGWRAAGPGDQTIRLCFDQPQRLRVIRLLFLEDTTARTQEFTLRTWREGDEHPRECVRQQFNFSPPQTRQQLDTYQVELDAVKTLELTIRPEIGGGAAVASLSELRLA